MVRRAITSRTPLIAACSAAAGMVVGYLCDPVQGRSRRARLNDRTRAHLRRGRSAARRRARYTAGRAVGLARRSVGAGRAHPVDGIDVVQAIRQQLARVGFPTTNVKIDVAGDTVSLRGEVADEQQMHRVKEVAARVPGVRHVESYLHLPGEPAPNKIASLSAGR